MGSELAKLQNKLRELSKISLNYMPDRGRPPLHAFPVELRGYSDASVSMAVCKKSDRPEFAVGQAYFMVYLGEEVCPKVLTICHDCYFMEYLYPAELQEDSLVVQESFLASKVWNRDPGWIPKYVDNSLPDWVLGRKCVIHGDPTLDNVLMTKQGFIRITDPIHPKMLRKPSIQAVDHGKILQSLLGWEVVLRGAPYIQYKWPEFMKDYDSAECAVFWAMVAVKRVAHRDMNDRITQWATIVGKGLEELCALSSSRRGRASGSRRLDI